MVVAPHHLASQSGLSILREGGNAIEAMIAAAATIAVVYPHMNGLGGDCFLLIADPAERPIGIEACGASGEAVSDALYERMPSIPPRGPLAANTVAGAVSGWEAALQISAKWGGRMPLHRLLEDAIHYAESGFPVTSGQALHTAAKRQELADQPGFAATFLAEDETPRIGVLFRQPRLAATLEHLGRSGLDDFYRGVLADAIAQDLAEIGSPLTISDLNRHRGQLVEPLSVKIGAGTLYNLPPPTQGLASLLILAIFDRLRIAEADSFPFVHGLVEATKCAFRIRDAQICDPDYMSSDPADFLTDSFIAALAAKIDQARAAPWSSVERSGDTVWLGAFDAEGRAVSFIQSLYWEFGAGMVLPRTGLVWQNRGSCFQLTPGAPNAVAPKKRPFHTIQPPLARLGDGRVLVYGTMGGDGQPQTQAAIFSRHVLYGQDLQAALTAPRWLLGRTWGAHRSNLRIEGRVPDDLVAQLAAAGHDVEVVEPFSEVMGHAGAISLHPTGVMEGAADPRGDGIPAGF
jgi:gamma-glutamyltranspeptidase/glutathione hydrolase